MGYRCIACGEEHEGLPDLGFDAPGYWQAIPVTEREQRTEMTSDTCIVDDEFFFIRGVIEIPINGEDNRFGFGVWVSLKKENFKIYLDNLRSDEIGPFFGWLSNEIVYYPVKTSNLKTMVHFQGQGNRPLIELEPTEHPLAVDQREGITLEKAWEMVHYYMGS